MEKRNGDLSIVRNGEGAPDASRHGVSFRDDRREPTDQAMQTISEANGGINKALLEMVQRTDGVLTGKVDCEIDFTDQSEISHDRKNDVVTIRRNVSFSLRKNGL